MVDVIILVAAVIGACLALGGGGILILRAASRPPRALVQPESEAERVAREERERNQRYWTREDFEAARLRARELGEDHEGVEIEYPLCADCDKRHPTEAHLRATGQGICEGCGLVVKDWPGWEPGARYAVHKLPSGRWCNGKGYDA